jgi:hypothetical protein
LHYFRNDLGRNCVSIADFSMALERVLAAFGVSVTSSAVVNSQADVFNLEQLATNAGAAFELAFFPDLRRELQKKLTEAPVRLEFKGLRSCVKQMLRAKRWSQRCQVLSDHIVEYLRQCFSAEEGAGSCGLVVR